jgi:hypothetical protein
MMGEYSGYAGFLSGWFDQDKGEKGEWVFEFSSCGVGIQHWWWGVHIVDLVLMLCMLVGSVVWGYERVVTDGDVRWKGIRMAGEKMEGEQAKDGTDAKTVVHSTRGRTSSVTEVRERKI